MIVVNRVLWTITAIILGLIAIRMAVMLDVGIKANLGGTYGPSPAITDFYAITGLYVDMFDGATYWAIIPPGLSHALDTPGILASVTLFFVTLAVTKTDLWYARERDAGRKPVRQSFAWLKETPRRLRSALHDSDGQTRY